MSGLTVAEATRVELAAPSANGIAACVGFWQVGRGLRKCVYSEPTPPLSIDEPGHSGSASVTSGSWRGMGPVGSRTPSPRRARADL